VAAAAGQVSQLLALAGVTGGAVLDLCCGPGRHSLEFARRGFTVTGVDRSPFLLERAHEKADAAALAVEWVLDDMRLFRRPGTFDLACNLFTSFGYFEQEEDNLRVLRNVWESLRDGGTLVMDMVGKERVARQGLNEQRTEFADGVVLIQQPRVNQEWTRMHLEWTVAKPAGESRTYRFEHHLYSGSGLQDRLRSCGFSSVRLFGDLQGSPYGPDATRLVAVACKA
jgi:SAM-dependent methyltransferase